VVRIIAAEKGAEGSRYVVVSLGRSGNGRISSRQEVKSDEKADLLLSGRITASAREPS
jgi:hypothetical protein